MAVQNKDLPRFSIVSQSPRFTRLSAVLAGLWLVLALAWVWLFWRGMDTDAAELRAQRDAAVQKLDGFKGSEARLKQELANANNFNVMQVCSLMCLLPLLLLLLLRRLLQIPLPPPPPPLLILL